MSYSENWLESKLREIVTPDMVSLWIPSGQKGGIDLIGRNPKVQCFGTHPNVPVISEFKSPNLLLDGGLNEWDDETHLTYWAETTVGSSTINREATEKVEGNFALRLDIDASNSSAKISQTRSLTSNKKHKIIVWYKNSVAGKTGRLMIADVGWNVYLYANGTWGDPQAIEIPNSTVWAPFELDFYGHPDYSNYYFQLQQFTAPSSSIYFDKISIEELKVSLINPSVGWWFDGDDYIDLGKDINIGKVHTCCAWFKIDGSVTGLYKALIGDDNGWATPLMVRIDLPSLYYHEGTSYKYVTWSGFETGVWRHIATVRNGTSVDFYIDAVKIGATQTLNNDFDVNIHTIGDRHSDSKWHGHIALPFVANKTWSIAQVKNFYNATKGMFAPRG